MRNKIRPSRGGKRGLRCSGTGKGNTVSDLRVGTWLPGSSGGLLVLSEFLRLLVLVREINKKFRFRGINKIERRGRTRRIMLKSIENGHPY